MSSGLNPFKDYIEGLAKQAEMAEDEKERIRFSLEVMDLTEMLLVHMAGDWFERYMKAGPKETEQLRVELTQGTGTEYQPWAEYISRYLEKHSDAFPIETHDNKIQSFIFMPQNGKPGLVNLNLGAPVKREVEQDFQGYKARTQVSIERPDFDKLVEGKPDVQFFQTRDPKLGKNYRIHAAEKNATTVLGIGIAMPLGLEILELQPAIDSLLSKTLWRSVHQQQDASLLKQLIRQARVGYEPPEGVSLSNHLFEQLETYANTDSAEAAGFYGEKIKPTMTLIGLFRPDLIKISRISSWDPAFHSKLSHAIVDIQTVLGENTPKAGKHHFYVLDSSHKSSLVLAEKNTVGDVIVATIQLDADDREIAEDKKVSTRVSTGLEQVIEPGATYLIKDLLAKTDHGERNNLLQGWTLRIPFGDTDDHVQLLLLKKKTTTPRSEVRSSWQESWARPIAVAVSAGLNMAVSGFTFLYEFSKANVEALGFDTAFTATAVIGIIAGIMAGYASYGIVWTGYLAVESVIRAVKSVLKRTDAGADQPLVDHLASSDVVREAFQDYADTSMPNQRGEALEKVASAIVTTAKAAEVLQYAIDNEVIKSLIMRLGLGDRIVWEEQIGAITAKVNAMAAKMAFPEVASVKSKAISRVRSELRESKPVNQGFWLSRPEVTQPPAQTSPVNQGFWLSRPKVTQPPAQTSPVNQGFRLSKPKVTQPPVQPLIVPEIELTLLPRKTAKLADFEKDLGKQRSEMRLFPGLTEHLEKVYKAWQIDEKSSEGKNITEKIKNLADRFYVAGMTIQHLAMGTKPEKPDLNGPKAPIRVREEKGSLTAISDRGNMVLTAVLTEDELREKGVFWRKGLENDPAKVAQYLNYAAKTHETWNSLDGGIGESVMREKWLLNRGLRARLSAILSSPQNAEAKYQPALAILRAAEEKGETDEIIVALREIEKLAGFESLTVKMGAKATDLGRDEEIRGNEYFVQDAEVRLLLIMDLAASRKFGKFTFQPFVNYQSRLSYEELMKRPCLWDMIEGRVNPRTYEQALKDSGAEVLDPLDQKDLPKFEINPGETHGFPALDSSIRAKGQPGGHGQWGVYYMINFTENTPPQDGFFHVLFFGNGDNRKGNPEPIVTGFLGVEKIPILKITTPATAIDKKGGKEGVRVIKNNGKIINVLEMFEEIDAKMAGQADLFYAAGQRNGFGQEGKQLFNTNLFYFNIDLLHSILTEMRSIVGQNDFLDAVMPTLFDKSEKAMTIDG
ncbi:MAG: hypothetical protein WC484_07680, partial [Candidatus Omnitrophota bacterium]